MAMITCGLVQQGNALEWALRGEAALTALSEYCLANLAIDCEL